LIGFTPTGAVINVAIGAKFTVYTATAVDRSNESSPVIKAEGFAGMGEIEGELGSGRQQLDSVVVNWPMEPPDWTIRRRRPAVLFTVLANWTMSRFGGSPPRPVKIRPVLYMASHDTV